MYMIMCMKIKYVVLRKILCYEVIFICDCIFFCCYVGLINNGLVRGLCWFNV